MPITLCLVRPHIDVVPYKGFEGPDVGFPREINTRDPPKIRPRWFAGEAFVFSDSRNRARHPALTAEPVSPRGGLRWGAEHATR
jgi:hypothetical protein